jgi:hypothetical protein
MIVKKKGEGALKAAILKLKISNIMGVPANLQYASIIFRYSGAMEVIRA